MKNQPPTPRIRHLPTMVVSRDRYLPMFQEPRCGALIGPGKTTIVKVLVTCPDCLKIMEEE